MLSFKVHLLFYSYRDLPEVVFSGGAWGDVGAVVWGVIWKDGEDLCRVVVNTGRIRIFGRERETTES